MFLALLFLTLFINVFGAEVEISNVDQFKTFVNDVNNKVSNYSGTTVFLESDLSLSEETLEPIGNGDDDFRGVFDGQGHIISNLKMSSSSYYTGLFGLSYGLTIRNVVLDSSCSITNSYSGSDAIYTGGIIGYCKSENGQCNIENNVNMADVTFSGNIGSNSRALVLGGVAGDLYSSNYDVYAKNCANYGSVTDSGTSSYTSYIGGIAGVFDSSSSHYVHIYNCLNYGTITHNGTTSSTLFFGGIVGHSKYAYIENCVSTGKMSSTKTGYIGSIVGCIYSYTYLNYCYATSDLSEYDLYGYRTPESSSYTLSYDSSTFELSDAVSVGSYTGTSLIDALNAAADYYSLRDYSKWLLNKEMKKVTFTINDRTTPITMDYQIILLPSLASKGSLIFYGWVVQ